MVLRLVLVDTLHNHIVIVTFGRKEHDRSLFVYSKESDIVFWFFVCKVIIWYK